ncbi:hypothetical protein G5V59_22835 [Nocardioides sp. W3-2-3]|nr:hypothetical protein [Nocardioides convexus]
MAVVGLGTAGAATAALLSTGAMTSRCWSSPRTRVRSVRASGCSRWVSRCSTGSGCWRTCGPPRGWSPGCGWRAGAGVPSWSLGYDARPASTPALGVHRGDLFRLLFGAVRARGIALGLGARVTAVEPRTGGLALTAGGLDLGRFDLVVGADGTRSRVRDALGLGHTDRAYRYGALWAIVPDPDGLTTDTLHQRFEGTRRTLGVLPTGTDRASIFWSLRTDRHAAALAAGVARWQEQARPMAGPYAALVEAVDEPAPGVVPVGERALVVPDRGGRTRRGRARRRRRARDEPPGSGPGARWRWPTRGPWRSRWSGAEA